MAKKKVIVGMSGGVDSSVSAYLLQQEGYAVEGLFMKNWDEDDGTSYCSAVQDVADAKSVCERLHIPLHTMNFACEYWDEVFTNFLSELKQGRTPNPDILCNKVIKFKAFLDYALSLGADFIATGHYVRKKLIGSFWQLLKGIDASKDQSYFLYTLTQQQLQSSLFPLGELQKARVRAIAHEQGFTNASKKDSTGICFIGERKFKSFLSRYLEPKPGDMATPDGKLIGRHDGLVYYTIGQRRGLGIGGQATGSQQPWYVAAKDLATNTLTVVQGREHPLLYKSELSCDHIHWISGKLPTKPLSCSAKTRYQQQAQPCLVSLKAANTAYVRFDHEQWAITPGQSVVFYDDDICLGGGIIADNT